MKYDNQNHPEFDPMPGGRRPRDIGAMPIVRTDPSPSMYPQALVEGEIERGDLRFPFLVLFQGTTKEKQRPWYRDGLAAGSIIDPNTGERFNGTYDKDTKQGVNRFTVLSVRKAFLLHRPRNASGDDNATAPIINETSRQAVLRVLTPEFMADNGWEPGDEYDPKEGVYVPEQLDEPFEWVVYRDGAEMTPPLLQTNFEFLCLFEDGFVGGLRFQSRRDGDQAGAAMFTAFTQSQMSPRPWCFIADSVVRESKTSGETWLGLQGRRAGLASDEHAALHAKWIETLSKTTNRAVGGEPSADQVGG